MVTIKYKVADKRGLHARNAVSLSKLAEGFKCRITMRVGGGGKEADCKNVMALMNLYVCENDMVELDFDGEDETAASRVLESTVPTFL